MSAALREPVRSREPKGGFIRLDAEYLVRIRPWLGDAEARVYEVLVLLCDGWERPTNASVIASTTTLCVDTVRRAIQRLEKIGLVRTTWVSSRTSPLGGRRFTIVREYDFAERALRATTPGNDGGGPRLPTPRSGDSRSYDHETPDRGVGSLLTRSPRSISPDPSLALRAKPLVRGEHADAGKEGREAIEPALKPSVEANAERDGRDASRAHPCASRVLASDEPLEHGALRAAEPAGEQASPVATSPSEGPTTSPSAVSPNAISPKATLEPLPAAPADRDGTQQAAANPVASPVVAEELVELARTLWTTDVTYKAARRYLGRLLVVGEPRPTTDEVARYLRLSAKSARLQRAKFPIAVACMPEEFADWLTRYRRMKSLPPASTRTDPGSASRTSDASQAALCGQDLAERAKQFCRQLRHQTTEMRNESQQEEQS